MKWISVLTVLPLAACEFGSEPPTKEPPTLEASLAGLWFPCAPATAAAANADCAIVDDDGLSLNGAKAILRIDGAATYAAKAHKDANGPGKFAIGAKDLYYFEEPESYSGFWSVKSDTLYTEGNGAEEPAKVKDANQAILAGDILELKPAGKKYRKYRGAAHVESKADFQKRISG